jgi:ParB family chromosome partitioning protein
MTDLRKLPVKQIALDKLVPSPERNVRRMIEEPVEPLAAAIAACGLLQNLVVHAMGKGVFGVCAGGRRLAALQLNRERGLIPADHKVNCVVVEEADARQVSLAENFAREAMNPADEARAFADLLAEGRSHAEIAAAFGQTERYVKARERLGRLAAPVFAAFQKRELSIEQAQAFAVNADAARQEAVFEAWTRAPHWEKGASHIRAMMTEDRVRQSDKRAVFVSREAYVAAGGAIDEDLFGDSVWFVDPELLTRLAQEKLEAAVDAIVAAEGWRWGATMIERDYAVLRGLMRVYPEEVELSEEDQARWDAINTRLDSEEMEDEEFHALEAELEAIDEKTQAFTEAQKAVSGVVGFLDNDGTIALERGLQRDEDRAAAKPAPAETGASDDDGGGDGGEGEASPERAKVERVVLTVGGGGETQTPAKPSRDPYSAALRADLRTVLKGALQIAVAKDPALARDLLEFELVMAANARFGWHDDVLAIRRSAQSPDFRHDGWAFDDAALDIPASRADAGFTKVEDVAEAFAAFRALPQADRDALLAAAVADSVKAALPEDQNGGPDYAHDWVRLRKATGHLVSVAEPDIRGLWTPTEDNFLGRVSKAVLLELVEATLGTEQARLLMGAKKGELVDHLHEAFNDPGARAKLSAEQRAALDAWVPAPLIFKATEVETDPHEGEDATDDDETDDAVAPDIETDAGAIAAE